MRIASERLPAVDSNRLGRFFPVAIKAREIDKRIADGVLTQFCAIGDCFSEGATSLIEVALMLGVRAERKRFKALKASLESICKGIERFIGQQLQLSQPPELFRRSGRERAIVGLTDAGVGEWAKAAEQLADR